LIESLAKHWRDSKPFGLLIVAPRSDVSLLRTSLPRFANIDVDVRSAQEAIGTLRSTHPFVIEAWVLLPDHMHALWTLPPGDEDFSYRWRVIKRMVTQRCQTRLNRPEWMNARRRKRNQSTLWQHRFWEHLIRDEADFNRHIDYIHWNPVKHGYVVQVSHWPYSSFHRYVKQGCCQHLGEST